jgi:MEMO1 family protein
MFNTKLQRILVVLVFPLFLTACSSPMANNILEEKEGSRNQPADIELNGMFYEEVSFHSALDNASNKKVQNNIQAIIVPHHLVASTYIADLTKMSSGRNIERVIIIGPNHENIGGQAISSAKLSWQTATENLESDQAAVEQFLYDLDLKEDTKVFSNEHSIGAHVSFVKHYFPQAKILPITFSSYAVLNDVEKVSQWLSANYNESTLIIFSIDFSHYLAKPLADEKDAITRQLILDKDLEKILELNNDYVDSPISLATALLFAKLQNLNTNIIYNGNSFDFLDVKPAETTSYFGISFTKE